MSGGIRRFLPNPEYQAAINSSAPGALNPFATIADLGGGVEEYANIGAFPVTGETDLIYIAADTNLIYRWDGVGYVAVGGTTVGTQYLGLWNATTNTPALVSSTHGGAIGDFYFVSPGGATLIDGINTWGVGDAIIWNGATWEKIVLSTVTPLIRVQTVAFATDSQPNISKSLPNSYGAVSTFEFKGSNIVGVPSKIKVLESASSAVSTHDIRIYDITNAQVIAEITGLTNMSFQLTDLGAISNIPTGPAIWELQAQRNGGGSLFKVGSITIEY